MSVEKSQADQLPLPTPEQLYNLFYSRRSIRGFDRTKDVPDETVEKIIDMARLSPSGGNGQPWEFIVIRDAEIKNKIGELYMRQLQEKIELEKAVRGFVKMFNDGFKHAPVLILVIGDPRVNKSYPVRAILDKAERHFVTGLANATYAIHLAARAFGLGSQYVSDAGSHYMSEMLKLMLGIPDEFKVYELVPIGYPVKSPDPTPRRSLEEMVHKEGYEMEKYRSDEQMEEFLFGQSRLGSYGASKKRGNTEADKA